MGSTLRGSNPGRGEIFRNCLDQPWGHPIAYNMGTGSFPGVKRPGCGVNHPHLSSAEVKERVYLYTYFPLWDFVACYRVKSDLNSGICCVSVGTVHNI